MEKPHRDNHGLGIAAVPDNTAERRDKVRSIGHKAPLRMCGAASGTSATAGALVRQDAWSMSRPVAALINSPPA
ncbi:MAG: hypothetical protein KIS83_18850 [Rubrivivax sp.]|nr:hypothetical protein [Rubrivivax sp.]